MKKALILVFIFIFSISLKANMLLEKSHALVKIFFTQNDITGTQSHLVGKVLSFSTKEIIDEKSLYDTYQEKSRAVIRLYSTTGIKSGDILYIIDQKNLVVSRFTADSFFKSKSFGDLLVGYGNFSQSDIGYRVVQKIIDEHSSIAFIHKARGDYFKNTGDTGKAIFEYKNAIKLDRGNPDAHLAIGEIYLQKGMIQYALKEYQEAYNNIHRLYDREDRFLVLQGLIKIRFNQFFDYGVPAKFKENYLKEGINYGIKALEIYDNSVEVNFMLGVLYYKSKNGDDIKARDYFIKVIELDNEHIDSYIALAELYLKHNNKSKAKHYIQTALKYAPSNTRVRELYQSMTN